MKCPKQFIFLLLMSCSFLCGPLHAQTGASIIAAVTLGNTTQCPTADQKTTYFGTITGGTCTIQVAWNNSLPTSLYATTCTAETAPTGASLQNLQIIGSTRTTTGFDLIISYQLFNQEEVGSGVPGQLLVGYVDANGHPNDSGGIPVYEVGIPPGESPGAPFNISTFGSIYVDCIASNQ
jgi:hypothetical protein